MPGFAQMALNMRADGADGLPDLDAASIGRHFPFFLSDHVFQEGYSLRRALAMERKGEFLYFSMNSLRVSFAFSGWLERP